MAIEIATAYVSILPSTAKLKPAIKAALEDIQADADRNPVNVKTNVDNRGLTATKKAIADLGKAAGSTAAVGAGVAAIGGAAGLAAGAVGVLGAGLAALGGAAGLGVATVAVGIHGIADAFKAASAAQNSYSDDAVAKAKAVQSAQDGVTSALRSQQSAERSLRDAKKASQTAEQDLTRARQEATRDLQDLNRELQKGKLDEEGAALSVAEAQRDLNKVRQTSTDPLEIADAQHRLNEALADQQDVLLKNSRTQQDANTANAKGVEGSDKVVTAQNNVAKANESVQLAQVAVTDANHKLVEANKALTDAQNQSSDSAKKYQQALQKLSPNAQAFVKQMVALGPALSAGLGSPVQDALFSGLGDSFTNLATTSIPALRDGMTGVAGALNNAAKQFASFFSQASSQDAIRAAFAGTRDVINSSVSGVRDLTSGVLNMAVAARPAMANVGTAIGSVFSQLGNTLTQLASSGALTTLFQNFAGIITSLGPTLSGLVSALTTLGNTAAPGIEALFTALGPALQGIAAPLGQLGSVFGSALASILPTLSQLIAALATGLQPVLPVVAQLLNSLGTALLPLVGPLSQITQVVGAALVQAITALGPSLGPLANSFAQMLVAVTPLVPMITNLAVNALGVLVPLIERLPGVLSGAVGVLQNPVFQTFAVGILAGVAAFKAYGLAIAAWGVATKIATGIQVAFDVAMDANPIGIIVVALAALVAGVIYAYTHFDTFRKIINDIGSFFVAVWRDGVLPVWNALVTAFDFAWNNILKPLFSGLSEAIRIAAGILLTVLIAPAILAWNLLSAVFKSVWETTLKPTWDAVAAAATWLWQNALKPAFDAIGAAATWLWQNAIKPAFDGIGAAISWVWVNIIKPTWDLIHAGLDAMGAFFTSVWHTVIEPVWNALGAGLKAVNDTVISPVWDAIKKALGTVKDAFRTAVDWIGQQWDRIKGIMATPINFVIQHVINDGIFKAWNSVAGFLHLDPLTPIDPIKLATGGYVSGAGGPTDDKIPAMLSNGEYVLKAATVNRIGVQNLDRINGGGTADGLARIAGLPALAAGGEVTAQLVSAHEFARSMDGRAYLMGGEAPGPVDCSGFMSAIADVVLGGTGHGRWWATTAFPKSQGSDVNAGGQHWVGGLGQGFSIGVIGGADSGGANGHTAGTLSAAGKYPAINVESGGSHGNVAYGGLAAGADNSEFPTRYHLPIMDGKFESAGNPGGGGLFSFIRDKVANLFEIPVKALEATIPAFPGPYGQMPKALYHKVADSTLDFIRGKSSTEDKSAGQPGEGPVRDQVQQAFARYGWGEGAEFAAASWIIGRESGWNPTAVNPSSGAFGLAQFLGSTKDQYLPDSNPNPGVQGDAMARYIRDRYGDPIKAQQFWMAHNWYDSGGIFPNNSIGINQSGKPEAVLTNDQWKLFTRFVQLLGQGKLGDAVGSLNPTPGVQMQTVVVNPNPGATGSPYTVTPSATQNQLTASDVGSRLQGMGNDFAQANVSQFLGDIGAPSSGDGAIENLVKQIQASVIQQINAQLAAQRTQSASFIGRR